MLNLIQSLLTSNQISTNNQATIHMAITLASGFLARAERDKIIDDISKTPGRIEPFGYKVYSQHEEDGIISYILEVLGLSSGRFLEIGVENGLECNSRLLLQKGWLGSWVDGNTAKLQLAEEIFRDYIEANKLSIINSFVSKENVNDIIAFSGGDNIDLLSIDIDGNDFYVWEKIIAMPMIVIIEYNAKFPPPLSFVQPYDEYWIWDHSTDDYGASLEALVRLGRRKGYRLVCCEIAGTNAFFVREDLARVFREFESRVLYHPNRFHLIQYPGYGSSHNPGKMIFEGVDRNGFNF